MALHGGCHGESVGVIFFLPSNKWIQKNLRLKLDL